MCFLQHMAEIVLFLLKAQREKIVFDADWNQLVTVNSTSRKRGMKIYLKILSLLNYEIKNVFSNFLYKKDKLNDSRELELNVTLEPET